MSSTPAKLLTLSNDIKTSGGIRKTLLTPCRRLGLSRIVKTPSSLEKIDKRTESPSLCSTPVNPKSHCISDTDNSCNSESKNKVVGSLKKPRKIVKKCLLLDENLKDDDISSQQILQSNEEHKTCKKKPVDVKSDSKNKIKNKGIKEQKKSAKKCLLPQVETVSEDVKERDTPSPELFSGWCLDNNSDSVGFKGFCSQQESDKGTQSSVTSNRSSDDDGLKSKNETVLNHKLYSEISDTEDDFQPLSKLKKLNSSSNAKPLLEEVINSSEKAKTSFKKRLSMKKSKCSNNSSFKCDSENEYLPSQENEQEVIHNVADLTDLPLLYDETETKAELPVDEDDFYEINENLLKEIENRLKEKENKLDMLKRAELYSKKHKVIELNELTMKWKVGCCEALKDLLELLKTRESHMNMTTLLKTLNIPENMIKYNSESGSFL